MSSTVQRGASIPATRPQSPELEDDQAPSRVRSIGLGVLAGGLLGFAGGTVLIVAKVISGKGLVDPSIVAVGMVAGAIVGAAAGELFYRCRLPREGEARLLLVRRA